MTPYETKKGFYIEFDSSEWYLKDFNLGINLRCWSWGEFTDSYIIVNLGFWSLSVGIRV